MFAYKGIAALSLLAGAWCSSGAPRNCAGIDPVKAVALVGLNPVIVIYGVGGGHNDLLMLALLVAGIYVLLRQREGTGGAMIMAATAIKLTAGMLLPFAIAASAGRRVGDLRARPDPRRRGAGRRGRPGGLGLVMFGSGTLHLVGTLSSIQAQGGIHSVPGFILNAIGLKRFDAPVGDGAAGRLRDLASSG